MTSHRTYRALGHQFDLSVEGTPPLEPGEVLADLEVAPQGPSAFRFGLTFPADGTDLGELTMDGELLGHGNIRVLLQLLIARLGAVISRGLDGLALHGTTVETTGGTVLLTAPSGRGKSTMSTKLLLDGGALVAEDISVIDPVTLAVQPYHRPLGLSELSFRTLGLPIPPEAGEPCGCGGKLLVRPASLDRSLAGPATPGLVAVVDRNEATLQRLSPGQALSRLLELGTAFHPNSVVDLDTLVRLLAGAHCVVMGSNDLDLAADWIAQLAASPPPAPTPTLVEQHGDRIDVYAGSEAVVLVDDESHHLNSSAAAVWLLLAEGLAPDDIAVEMQADPAVVDAAMAEFAAAGLR